jgi:cytochrome P450 family 110
MNARDLPGPRGRLLTTYRLLAKPFEWMPRWRAQYGDPFLLHAINGDVVVTGRPDLIKALFAAPPASLGPFGVQAIAPVVGKGSLLVLDGEAHRRERKLLMPPFHGARMRAYADTMREVAHRRFAEAAGRSVTMVALAQEITLEIIVRAVFGIDDPRRVGEAMDSIIDTIDRVHPAFVFAPFLQRELGGFGPYARFRRAFEHTDAMLQAQIDEGRTRGEGDDILSLLLAARYDDGSAMSDEEIRDELRTIVVAGHETTAMTLAFLVDLLWRSPEALSAARAEAEEAASAPSEALARLPYLDAVVKETLRLRPILTESMRSLKAPLTLGHLEIPAGMHVAASMVLAHHDPARFPEPERFRPARFLDDQKPTPNEYLPFGGGHRRCLGAAFADMELRIVIAELLASHDLTLESPARAEPLRRNVSMTPAGGVPLRLRRRELPERPAAVATAP